MLTTVQDAPIHRAAVSGYAAAVWLLLQAAPNMAFAPNADGNTPLHLVLRNAPHECKSRIEETARCLVRATPAVQPALGILVLYNQHATTLFADLVARLPLTQEQWQSIPAPCPDLARALPAVLERSVAEAGWLVGRLAEGQRARLPTAVLSLVRVQHERSATLSPELNRRILALSLLNR